VVEELESTGHGGAYDGAVSDAFDARFRARGAYWTVSDTTCGVSDEKHWSVRSSLKRPLKFERARHVARSGAPDAAECVRCLCVGASGAPDLCPTALFKRVSLYILVWPVLGLSLESLNT
jgi:hypothetical protein